MSRSINSKDTDWRREWDEEQRLTSEELKQRKKEEEEERQIIADCDDLIRELRMEEKQRERRQAQRRMEERGWPKSAIWILSDDELRKLDEDESERELCRCDYHDDEF